MEFQNKLLRRLPFNMRGFTLIETIIYMAISTFLCTSLIAFSLSLISVQSSAHQELETEMTGSALLRLVETDIRNNIPFDPLVSASSSMIRNFTRMSTSSLTSISFSLDNHEFNLTFKP